MKLLQPSPNQAFAPALLFGIGAGVVISNNIFILKALACDFYYLSHHEPVHNCSTPKVEQITGFLTTAHAVVAALLGGSI